MGTDQAALHAICPTYSRRPRTALHAGRTRRTPEWRLWPRRHQEPDLQMKRNATFVIEPDTPSKNAGPRCTMAPACQTKTAANGSTKGFVTGRQTQITEPGASANFNITQQKETKETGRQHHEGTTPAAQTRLTYKTPWSNTYRIKQTKCTKCNNSWQTW